MNPGLGPFVPPLDGDCFAQHQRVVNDKHSDPMGDIMRDLGEAPVHNFDVTMETARTTLEHTIRMLETTGDNRVLKKSDLKKK